jgi:hypothetical protein
MSVISACLRRILIDPASGARRVVTENHPSRA